MHDQAIKNLITMEDQREFSSLPLDVQMRLLRGERVQSNTGQTFRLEQCLEGILYKRDGTIQIIQDRRV